VAVLIWAGPAAEGCTHFWHQTISVDAGPVTISEDLQQRVIDGLIAIFVVGLEKRT
jgi:Na+/H+ antiporter NhaA